MPMIANPSANMSAGDASQAGFHFSHNFEASDLATRSALELLSVHMSRAGIGPEDQATLELILAEALNNVTEHAYAGTTGPVVLVLCTSDLGITCRITDRGKPMPNNDAPNPDLPEISPPDELPEGGFGWNIIRCLTQDLRYSREGPWNSLTLVVPLSDTAFA